MKASDSPAVIRGRIRRALCQRADLQRQGDIEQANVLTQTIESWQRALEDMNRREPDSQL